MSNVQLNITLPENIPTWKIESLIPYDNNPRTHSEEQINQLVASMVEFGFTNPNCLPKRATRNMAQKNGGYAFFYVSSVSFDAFIAWIVASTIFNSLSSKAFNMASIRFLHSLPLFWDG